MSLDLVKLQSPDKNMNFSSDQASSSIPISHFGSEGCMPHHSSSLYSSHYKFTLLMSLEHLPLRLLSVLSRESVHQKRVSGHTQFVSFTLNKAWALGPQGLPLHDLQNIQSLKLFILLLQRAKSAFTSSSRAENVHRNEKMSPDSTLFHSTGSTILLHDRSRGFTSKT